MVSTENRQVGTIDGAVLNKEQEHAAVTGGVTVPALRLRQGDTTLYVTALPGSILAMTGFTRADAWSPENRQGYQRPPLERRFKGIAEYILGDEALQPLLPQAIILNARNPLIFEGGSSEGGLGKLTIPNSALPLYEVDGQHRIGGLRRAVEEDPGRAGQYEVPVVILDGVDRMTEAVTFYVINTEQKRVPTDIAQRLIAQQMEDEDLRERVVGEGKAWIATATKIVDELNATPGQPWFERIGVPGVESRHIIRQVSFVQSLKPYIDAHGEDEVGPSQLAQILVMYWQAMQELWPAAFEDPRNYVIQKTVGIFPLHAILPSVVTRVLQTDGHLTKGGFKKVLRHITDDAEFWHKDSGEAGKYAGAKGFRILADILRKQLPPLKPLTTLEVDS